MWSTLTFHATKHKSEVKDGKSCRQPMGVVYIFYARLGSFAVSAPASQLAFVRNLAKLSSFTAATTPGDAYSLG